MTPGRVVRESYYNRLSATEGANRRDVASGRYLGFLVPQVSESGLGLGGNITDAVMRGFQRHREAQRAY